MKASITKKLSHNQNRDVVNQLRRTAVARGIATAAGVEQSKLVQLGVELAYRRPSSRKAEKKADRSGLRMLTEARYSPQAMVSFMKKLNSNSKASVPRVLSTHPPTASRVQYLQAWVNSLRRKGNDGTSKLAYRRNISSLR